MRRKWLWLWLGVATALVACVVAVVLITGARTTRNTSQSPQSSQSPPGANNWRCRPSADHPDPVVLVHATFLTMQKNWSRFSPLLADAGYCVFALDYGRRTDLGSRFSAIGGLEPMETSAQELSAFVNKVLSATGGAKVDIVGHSQGSLMPDYYVKFLGGAAKVARYVGIAPLWGGTTLADGTQSYKGEAAIMSVRLRDSRCRSCPQFLPGSAFLNMLGSDGGPRVPGVAYTMLMTKDDELVRPYTSGFMAGATNIVVQDVCPSDRSNHALMAADGVVLQLVFNALDPAHTRSIRCGAPAS